MPCRHQHAGHHLEARADRLTRPGQHRPRNPDTRGSTSTSGPRAVSERHLTRGLGDHVALRGELQPELHLDLLRPRRLLARAAGEHTPPFHNVPYELLSTSSQPRVDYACPAGSVIFPHSVLSW